MGDPAAPTALERADTHALASAIVDSVIDDGAPPHGWNAFGNVFRLAQEVVMLTRERDDLLDRDKAVPPTVTSG